MDSPYLCSSPPAHLPSLSCPPPPPFSAVHSLTPSPSAPSKVLSGKFYLPTSTTTHSATPSAIRLWQLSLVRHPPLNLYKSHSLSLPIATTSPPNPRNYGPILLLPPVLLPDALHGAVLKPALRLPLHPAHDGIAPISSTRGRPSRAL